MPSLHDHQRACPEKNERPQQLLESLAGASRQDSASQNSDALCVEAPLFEQPVPSEVSRQLERERLRQERLSEEWERLDAGTLRFIPAPDHFAGTSQMEGWVKSQPLINDSAYEELAELPLRIAEELLEQHNPPAPLALHLDPHALRPLLREIVAEVLGQVEADRARVGDRLAYGEEEAARLLGLQPHQLRDERLRGRIAASSIVGRRVRYMREDLIGYLMSRRTGGK